MAHNRKLRKLLDLLKVCHLIKVTLSIRCNKSEVFLYFWLAARFVYSDLHFAIGFACRAGVIVISKRNRKTHCMARQPEWRNMNEANNKRVPTKLNKYLTIRHSLIYRQTDRRTYGLSAPTDIWRYVCLVGWLSIDSFLRLKMLCDFLWSLDFRNLHRV